MNRLGIKEVWNKLLEILKWIVILFVGIVVFIILMIYCFLARDKL